MKRYRKRSIYIDTYTGEVGSATQFKFYPAARPHRFIFVGLYWKTPAINGRILKTFLKRNGMNIELKKVPRKIETTFDNSENYF